MEKIEKQANDHINLPEIAVLQFQYLPDFAAFVKDMHLREYVAIQLKLSREYNLPLLRYFAHLTDEEIINVALEGHREVLDAFAENKAQEFLQTSLRKWVDDNIEFLSKNDVAAEDVLLTAYIRKQALKSFLNYYTADAEKHLQILAEIDEYNNTADVAAMRIYSQLLRERLSEREKLYRQAQAIGKLGNWSRELATNKITWSDEVYDIYQIEPGTEIDFEKVRSMMHPDDVDRVKVLDDAVKKLEPYELIYRIVLPDGTIKHLQARGDALVDKDGKPYRAIGTLQDITAQINKEQELRSSREFIQKVANTTPSIIATYNIHTGDYLFINSAVEHLLGFTAGEVLRKGKEILHDRVHPDDAEQLHADIASDTDAANEDIESANIGEYKYRIRHANGEYRWLHTYSTVFDRDEAGKVQHVLYVSVDITDQEEAEQELNAINEQLRVSNDSLKEFAYVASHDLKEPLRKISTFANRLVIKEKDNLSEDGKQYLDKMMNAAGRMQQMISDVLSLSVISSNRQYEPVLLNNILADVQDALEHKITEKNAQITIAEMPRIHAVPAQMRQLFMNLINNALKFVKPDTQPQIDISCTRVNRITQKEMNLPMGNYYQLSVADNGIGFDEEQASKIFDIFNRLHSRDRYEGTGIGLSICKKIAENHIGRIWAEGAIDGGATFHILLPEIPDL